MTKKIIIFIIIILIIFAVVFIISGYKSKSSEEELNPIDVKIENKTNSDESDNDANANEEDNIKSDRKVREFDMVAKQFTYEPNTITVDKGDIIVINIVSEDVPHSFTLPDLGYQNDIGINELLVPGKEVTIEFIADKKGEFVFGCDVACGSGHSDMLGKIIVMLLFDN